MPAPEGFIMPLLGTNLGGNVMKVYPSAAEIAGAMGTMSAEIVRHREFNAEKTKQLELDNIPGEMTDEIELVKIKADKFTTVPLRASNLSDPKARFHNELSIEQQMQLAELRERFRKNEHGSDTPIAMWDALSVGEQMQLVNFGVMYVEQLAAFPEHEYYKLGNGGAELVKRAQRHVGGKVPSKQEEFEKSMSIVMQARAEDKARADAAEAKYFALQERLAALESSSEAPKKRGRPFKAGVQEVTE